MFGICLFGVWYFWFRPDNQYQVDPEKIKAFYNRDSLKTDSGT
jgi:cbb3-type cytochrome oxidase subunit 3